MATNGLPSIYACPCLNVQVRPQPAQGDPPATHDEFEPVYAGDEGISVVRLFLLVQIYPSDFWKPLIEDPHPSNLADTLATGIRRTERSEHTICITDMSDLPLHGVPGATDPGPRGG